MAWCFVCLIEAVWIAVTAKKKMSTLSYVGEVPVALHILTIAVLFAVLYILFEKIKNIRTEKMLLVLVTVLYAFTAVIQTPDTIQMMCRPLLPDSSPFFCVLTCDVPA